MAFDKINFNIINKSFDNFLLKNQEISYENSERKDPYKIYNKDLKLSKKEIIFLLVKNLMKLN